MVDTPQAEGAKAPKQSLFRTHEWPGHIWNWFARLPVIERVFRPGRVRVSKERMHPIEKELRTSWLTLNDTLFTVVENIEVSWDKEYGLIGGDDKANFLAKPEGIVSLYKKLGAYADKDRVEVERHWFQFGTGYEETKVPFELPTKPDEWKKYGWQDKSVNALRANTSEPWKSYKARQYKLKSGTIFHEAKEKEELHTFGYVFWRQVGEELKKNTAVVLEDLRRKRIAVEIRTKISEVNTEFIKLFEVVAGIDQKNYEYLSGITPDIKPGEGTWDKLWHEIFDEIKPESRGIRIRFPHTYRITMLYINEKIEEKIMKVNDEGDIVEEKLRVKDQHGVEKELPIISFKIVYFDPEKNPYPQELKELERKIRDLGGETTIKREADAHLADVRRITREIENLNNMIRPKMQNAMDNNYRHILITDFQEFVYTYEYKKFLRQLINNIVSLRSFIKGRGSRISSDEFVKNQYFAKIQELQTFIYEGLKQLKVKPNRLEKTKIDNNLAKLYEEPYDNSKKNITSELYLAVYDSKNKTGVINRYEEDTRRIAERQLESFLEKYKDELSKGPEGIIKGATGTKEEYLAARVKLFDAISTEYLRLFEITEPETVSALKGQIELKDQDIRDERALKLKKFVDKCTLDFDALLDREGISDLFREKDAKTAEKVREIERRRELLDPILKRDNINHFWDELKPNNPKFYKRPEEKQYGLDENGYPLEIDPNDGMVLIDKWWKEIGQNEWQLKTIALKPGGVDVLKTHLGVTVKFNILPSDKSPEHKDIEIIGTPNRPIRYVDDKRFRGHVDLLDAACMLFGTWDSVRDDLRDGRYHPYSKTIGDYVIEGMGNFEEERGAPFMKSWGPEIARSRGLFVKRRGIIPESNAGFELDLEKDEVLINAKPSDFDNVPDDEKAITRKFKMRLPATLKESDLPKISGTNILREDIIKTPDKKYFMVGERKPTKYNPAFDRRAQFFKYMHWGCMYYYRWPAYPNEWSENPFPGISTRGLALWIAYLTASDVWAYAEGEESLKGHKYDYGVRGQGKFGYNNPLSGDYILQEN